LLAQREVFRGEFRSVTKNPAEEQHQDTYRAHFTVSENHNHGSETIVTASKPSNRNSLSDNAYGIFGMDNGLFG